LDSKHVEAFKAQMKLTISDRNKESIELETSLNNQLENLNKKLDGLERKYALEGLDVKLYQKFRDEIENEKGEKIREKANLSLKISNLDKKIEKCSKVTQNISKYWKSSSTDIKIRIQKLVFPSGIVIDPKKRQYRTSEINSVYSLISVISISIRSFSLALFKILSLKGPLNISGNRVSISKSINKHPSST
jgi:hypothetical protein